MILTNESSIRFCANLRSMLLLLHVLNLVAVTENKYFWVSNYGHSSNKL